MSRPNEKELAELIARVEGYVRSARNALSLANDDSDKPSRVSLETARLGRMVHAWLGLETGKELEIRMHFTEGLDFFSRIKDQSQAETAHYAQILITRVTALNPKIGAKMRLDDVAHAIARRIQTDRFDWKAMEKAWGSAIADREAWRTGYSAWKKTR